MTPEYVSIRMLYGIYTSPSPTLTTCILTCRAVITKLIANVLKLLITHGKEVGVVESIVQSSKFHLH